MLRSNNGRGALRRARALSRAVNFSIERLERRVLLSAVIATNLGDYSPGSTAQINGTGFMPGEAVQLQVR
ncbi:MAG: LEPR-XLL domain-containing protein, partial [Tepidisphaeraceae bacterium]